MSGLNLRLNMYGDEPLGSTEVVANIFPTDRTAPQDLRARLREITIPAGDQFDQWASVDVPPGHYEVQVSLPSGELLMHDVEVTAGGDAPQQVALETQSPYEFLSFQHLQGNVGDWDSRSTARPQWVEQSVTRGATHQTTDHLSGGTASQKSAAPVDITWCPDPNPADTAVHAWDLVYDIIRDRVSAMDAEARFIAHLQATGSALPAQPYFDDNIVRTYRFTYGGLVQKDGQRPASLAAWDQVTPERRYAIARDDVNTRLVCAPVPWFDLRDPDRETAFEIMSPLGSAGVTTAIRDTRLGAIIGYLTAGAAQNASRLLKPARDMLLEKVANPLGAAAGAYVLVVTNNDRSDQSWHHWVGNLNAHFNWIPDGAIALAKLRLNHQTSDGDVDEALDAALAAYRRGLPFYSMGMRWLLDTLTAFVDDDDYAPRRDEICHCLERVRVVARRTNYQQPFTSILLSHVER